MSMVSGIDAKTGQVMQADSSKLVNTYMSEEWESVFTKAINKALAQWEATGAKPRNGFNVLLDGEYHFFNFDSKCNRRLSEAEIKAFQQEYAENPCGNTLWKILAKLSQMGVVNGKAAFDECMASDTVRQPECWRISEPHNDPSVLEDVLARLDSMLYGISLYGNGIDKNTDADTLEALIKKYESLQKIIQLIAGM